MVFKVESKAEEYVQHALEKPNPQKESFHDVFTSSTACPQEIALEAFRQQYPTFDTTQSLDRLRATGYARLDTQQHVYLDYTGGSLYADSQVREHLELLCSHVFGNPHSTNPASQAMTDLVEQARRYILTYFHALPDEYVVIFTPNASGALKLVASPIPFPPMGGICLPSITTTR